MVYMEATSSVNKLRNR